MDGKTKDGKPSAHYEHTVCVRKDKADILSSFDSIEAAEKANEQFVFGLLLSGLMLHFVYTAEIHFVKISV